METILIEIDILIDNLAKGAIHFVPNLILSIVVFFIGLLIAWIVKKSVKSFILYLNRGINEKLRNRFLSVDLESSVRFISKTFYWIILVFTIALVIQILELPILNSWFSGLVLYLPNILAAVVIIFVGFIAGKLLSDLVLSATKKTGLTSGKYLGRSMQYIIVVISVIIAIDQIGIDIVFLTNLITIVIAVLFFGAALSFALGAKTSVSNILGSYYVQKVYQPGSIIRMGEYEGLIVKITATNVFLETKNGVVSIPAKKFNEEKTVLTKKS